MVNFKVLGVELLLVGLFCVMSIGFVVTYVIAVNNDHVSPYFPYISDTGSDPPESCIFSFICSVGAILVLIITYIRHKHLSQHYEDVGMVKCLNFLATVLGLLSVLGLLLVGSFQDNKVLAVHLLGAIMVFGCGVLYEWVQLLISFKIYRSNLNQSHFIKCVLVTRLILSIIGTVCFLATQFIASAIKHSVPDAHFWTSSDGKYALHVFSTGCEWLMSLTFLLYFLTFHVDFVKISVDVSVKARFHHMSDDERTPLQL